jgi:hypothetical protein
MESPVYGIDEGSDLRIYILVLAFYMHTMSACIDEWFFTSFISIFLNSEVFIIHRFTIFLIPLSSDGIRLAKDSLQTVALLSEPGIGSFLGADPAQSCVFKFSLLSGSPIVLSQFHSFNNRDGYYRNTIDIS